MEENNPREILNAKPFIKDDTNVTTENSVNITIKVDSNLNSDEIDAETVEKLRGDAIGSTLYSESFVARTLLQLSDLQWSEKLEEDLCFLWDMTLEKDVCNYLLRLSYPSIACVVIEKHDENRLIEIIVGILANICCITDTVDITNEQAELVLALLRSDDPLILIQVARFIKALAYDRETLPFINDAVVEQFSFILTNSYNVDLLTNTLDALSKMTAEYKLDANLVKGELMKVSVIAYQCISNKESERLSLKDNQIESNQQRTALTHLIQIVSNICCYINKAVSGQLLRETNKYSNIFVDELSKVFSCYSKDESFLPVTEELQFYVDAVVFIFQILNVTYQRELFKNIINITSVLLKNKCEDVDLFLELDCYFIFVGKLDELKSDLRCFKKIDVYNVLNKINCVKPICDFAYKENLDALLIEFKT